MDLESVLALLAAFGAGGVITSWVSTATDRRTRRADLLDAQQAAAGVPYNDLAGFHEAADRVRRLGMIAGVPPFVLRHHQGTVYLEHGAREKEVTGRTDSGVTFPTPLTYPLYMEAEEMLNFAIWHPWLARMRSPFWYQRIRRVSKGIKIVERRIAEIDDDENGQDDASA